MYLVLSGLTAFMHYYCLQYFPFLHLFRAFEGCNVKNRFDRMLFLLLYWDNSCLLRPWRNRFCRDLLRWVLEVLGGFVPNQTVPIFGLVHYQLIREFFRSILNFLPNLFLDRFHLLMEEAQQILKNRHLSKVD